MKISVRHIQELVAADFQVPRALFFSRCRHNSVSHPRQVAMYLARETTGHSLPLLGRIFARDHTTILSGIRAVKRRIGSDRSLALKIEARKLLLECETANGPLVRALKRIPVKAAQKIVVMSKWERGEITADHAAKIIRELRLQTA